MATPKTTAKTTAKKAAAPAKASKAPAAKTAKAPAAKKAVKADPPARQARTAVPAEQRRNYIEVAAYFIAERHGFTPGRELQDWAAAEAEIDRLLAAGLLNP
ncbi:MAG TPA: DUF2934 domain-containing protein [Rhodocyclaceae bacterium]